MKTRLLEPEDDLSLAEPEDEERTTWAWRQRQDWAWRWRQDYMSLKMKTGLLEPDDKDKTELEDEDRTTWAWWQRQDWDWRWRQDYLSLRVKAFRYLETTTTLQTTTRRNFPGRLESSGEYTLSTKLNVIRSHRSVLIASGLQILHSD